MSTLKACYTVAEMAAMMGMEGQAGWRRCRRLLVRLGVLDESCDPALVWVSALARTAPQVWESIQELAAATGR